MLYYLHYFSDMDYLGAFNVFQYVTFRASAAAVTAFLISILFGDWIILRLRALKLGQPIRTAAEVHKLAELHGGKSGTPTMGGVLIIASVVLSAMLWARSGNPLVWLGLFTLIFLGALGFLDDYTKVKKKSSDGISGKLKLAGQFFVATVITLVFYFMATVEPDIETRPLWMAADYPGLWEQMSRVYVPFFKEAVIGGLGVFTLVFFGVVIMGTSNGVNLTDGLDGLAIGCTITTAAAFAVLNYLAGDASLASGLLIPFNPHTEEVAVLCASLAGAGLGFLWFNCYPAKVFMGDTGSLAIGGFLGFAAIACKQEFLLIVVGGIFVLEVLSVIIQVISFKTTGKRVFRMSPLHHHFELSGWKENTVIVRFWILSVLFAVMGLATLKLR